MCLNKHLNENVRGNQKYCRVCGEIFIDDVTTDESPRADDDFENYDCLSSVTVDKSSVPLSVFITPMDRKDKSKLFPKIRNHMNPNQPVYESEGCLFVNPNTFDRLVMVFEEIQKKTGTFEKYTSSITVNDDDTITVESWDMTNVRSYVLVTVDGLPHKMAIDVLKHCYHCKECDKNISSLPDLNNHMKKYGHKTFFKRFSNIILKIGGLHLHMNMLRSFVSLNWNIDYSFICSSIGFQSPKAQLFQQKVQDMHKCSDTFNARRFAKIREYARGYVKSIKNKDELPSADKFEKWLKNDVKSDNFKLNVEIDKLYGTSLWLCLAAQRANYWKLFKASVRVFSGLFHINGNSFYSVIEIYDEYLMKKMEVGNKTLHDHLVKRLFTNLTGVPYCAQSHDARHEEQNKKGQNMFPGSSLEELDLAFTIVDDVWKLRDKVFEEMGIPASSNTSVVVPNLEPLVLKMRFSMRKKGHLENPHKKSKLTSFTGKYLHTGLLNIFENSEKRRRSDILNVIRYNDFSFGFNSKPGKIGIFEDSKLNEISEDELRNQILILINSSTDVESQNILRTRYAKLKTRVEIEEMIESLVNNSFPH